MQERKKVAPRARFELTTLRLTAANLISSQVAGAELNRGKSASSDQIGLVGFFFSFLFLLAFCSFSRRSYDTYMTLADLSGKNRKVDVIGLIKNCTHDPPKLCFRSGGHCELAEPFLNGNGRDF